jgi:CHAT domain-containing protein/tetratricopeptide (TPR) repeat protein
MSFRKCVKFGLALLALTLNLCDSPFKSGGFSLSAFAEASPNASNDTSLPAAGKSIEQELSAGQTDSYQFSINEGSYLRIVIEVRGTDASVTVREPGGRSILNIDCREYLPTAVSLIAEVTGAYRLEVRSLEGSKDTGRYELTTEVIKPATPIERQRLAAERMVAEAEHLSQQWNGDASRAAIQKFKQSLPLWSAAQARTGMARALRRIGDVYQTLGEYRDALASYNLALPITREAKDRRGEAESLNEIGYVFLGLGENPKAWGLCNQALELSRAAAYPRGQARALNNLGEVSYGLGKLQQSLEFYQRAMPLWLESSDRQGRALTFLNFGYTYSDLGQMREALASYDQALPLWTAALNARGKAMTLTAIGRLYSRMGENQQALDHFKRAMQLMETIGALAEKGRTITGMAYVYDQLGDHQKAIDLYDQAIALFSATGDFSGKAVSIYDAGKVYFSLGENEKALEYYQRALETSKTANDRRLQSFELREIARVYDSRGDRKKALDHYLSALTFLRTEKNLREEAQTLNLIAGVYENWGQKEKAFAYYHEALILSRKAEFLVGEAATQYNIARLERDRGNLNEARHRMDAALSLVESLRRKVTSQDLRASYFATVRQHYELYIDILMKSQKQDSQAGFETAAFDISERARARSLLESLNEARADIRQGVEPALLERERNLEQEINVKAGRHAQLVASKDNVEAQTVATQLNQLTTEYDEVKAQIKSKSPRYAALTQPQPLSLKEIQSRLLDDNSLLLEYMLGDERSYLWAVTRTEISSYELPPRAQIEDAAQKFRNLLTAHQPVAGESFDQRQARIKEADDHIWQAAASFSQMILGPVNSKLGTKRLLVVPDGVLQYIPFQALTVPPKTSSSAGQARTPGDSGQQIPLLVDHEIVNEPSASALALVLSDTSQRKPAPNSIAVFANPVFEVDDPRVKSPGAAQAQSADSTESAKLQETFSDIGFGEGKIPALPASRDEAEAIMAVAPWGTGMKALGFDANRAAITKPELAQYRIVHFATHGFIDYQHPELSGLVLSLVDQNGRPQEGFVRLHDIYNLKLSADLVVLSACNTGLGKDVKGEGLIGLTRGFMYAGAGGVAASLWKVDDDATAELMKHFYEGMFKRGLTPAAALREAQLGMWKQKRWQAPYYWAAFVIQGQYDQQEMTGFERSPGKSLAITAGIGVTLFLAAILLLRRRRKRIL